MKQGEQMSLFDLSSDEVDVTSATQGRSMKFQVERDRFNHLRSNLEDEAKEEYELGVKYAVERYNTAIYENRFLVGGVVEFFTLALMRSTGIKIEGCGAEAQGGDLILPTGEMFSLKSSFTKSGSVILVNTRGDSETNWTTATLFVISNVGIIYGDPEMAEPDDLVRVSDNLQIKRKAFMRFAEIDSNRIDMSIPFKPPTKMAGSSLKASEVVARELMRELRMTKLLEQIE